MDRIARANARFLPFGGLASDVTTDRSEYVTVYPTGGIAGPTIEFNISAAQAGFVSLSQSYILSRLTVVKDAAHTAVKPFTDNTAPGEGFADSWSNIQLFINGVDVSDATPGTYPYAAWYKNALVKGQDWVSGGLSRFSSPSAAVVEDAAPGAAEAVCRTLATPAGWGAEFQGYALTDKAVGSSADIDSIAGRNWGAVSGTPFHSPGRAFRQSKIAYSGKGAAPTVGLPKSEWITIPQLGMWQNAAYIPANVDIRLVLTKPKDGFALEDNMNATSAISWAEGDSSVRLMLKRVYADSAMQEEFDRAILERPLRYNLTRSRVERSNIQLSSSVDVTNLLTGVRPDTVIVQFVATSAVEGNYSYNPFASTSVIQLSAATASSSGPPVVAAKYALDGDYVSSIYVSWAGRQVPLRPITATSVNDTGEAYAAYLAAASGGVFGEKTPMISPAGFRGGRVFYCFQLNADGARAGTQAMNLSDRGSLEVHATIERNATFSEATTMVVVGFHSASVEIDATRSIRKDGF